MFNKVIIGMLVFLLVLTGTLCAYAFDLAEEIHALSERLTVSQEEIDASRKQLLASEKEQAAQISVLRRELATFRGQALARIDGLDNALGGVATEVRGVANELEQSVINAAKLYPEVSKGIVRISDGEKTVGSGFIFGADGHIVIPYHLVEGQDQIDVILPDGSTSAGAIIGTCEHSDIALLTLEQGLTMETLTLADSTTVRAGEPIIVIGNPFELPGTITSGIVSQTHRFVEVTFDSKTRWVANLIQFDAAINFRSSGSPLLNSKGEVIGMVIARVDPKLGDGVYYAISSNKLKRVAHSLIGRGSFNYPWLGVEIANLTPETVRARNLETANGALVKKIIADSPAEVAGVKVNDVIVGIDELTVQEVADFTCYLGEYKSPGDVVTIALIRDGTKLEPSLKIGKR